MKPRSSSSYVAVTAGLCLIALLAVAAHMRFDLHQVRKSIEESHRQAAADELDRSTRRVLEKAHAITDFIADWDETHQQISNPTYYIFWRDRRLPAVTEIPAFVEGVELYSLAGQALRHPYQGQMPETRPAQDEFVTIDASAAHLFMVKPIHGRGSRDKEVIAYVAIKLNLLRAMLALNSLEHIERNSLRLASGTPRQIPATAIAGLFAAKERHYDDLERFTGILHETLIYLTLILLATVVFLYAIVSALFNRPLHAMDRYIDVLRKNSRAVPPDFGHSWFRISEIEKLADSLKHYQQELGQAQAALETANRDLEDRVTERTRELQRMVDELSSFSYSVSHDLRSPLRSIDGFSQILQEEYSDKLDDTGKGYIERIHAAALRMGQLIDDMLMLSRIGRHDMQRTQVDLSRIARDVASGLGREQPERSVEISIQEGLRAFGDDHLLRIVLENLLGNAWKYTGRSNNVRIEFGQTENQNQQAFFVRDNGVGFDMRYADKLFGVFQRLHSYNEFEGTGIGLATVERIIKRHGGKIWAEAEPGKGATFYFTLPA